MAISSETQATFDYLFGLASKVLLDNHRSFEPFATATTLAGQRTHSTSDLGTHASSPTEHISALLAVLADRAATGGLKSAGLAFNARTPAGMGGGEDCVCVHAETAAGEAVQVFVPYTRMGVPRPAFSEPVIQDVAPRIFVR
jgi:hypothetical protein